jgi:hypothetical protein
VKVPNPNADVQGTKAELTRLVGVCDPPENDQMTLGTILLIILIVVLIGAISSWPYSRGWGYYPSGGVGIILLILIILLLMGRL